MTKTEYINAQFDLFLPYISDLPLRDQRETMERPFFSLSKRKRLKPIEYVSPDGKLFVNVYPNPEFGMATIWDADILIWAASYLNSMKKKGINDIPRELHVQPYDILTTVGRRPGGREYQLFTEALGRLQSTTIRTNIRPPKGSKKDNQFSWIDSWTGLVNEETNRSQGVRITLSDWFYKGVLEEGGLLSIDPAYFTITGGRERWLYRVARKHAGDQPGGFAIAMPTLFEKSGAEGTYRRFKFEILAIVRRNNLPGYFLTAQAKGGEPELHMLRRDFLGEGGERPAKAPRKAAEPRAKVPPPPTPVSAMPLLERVYSTALDDKTIADVRRDFPGWDIYALKSEFDTWIAEKADRKPGNYQSAFYGFVRRYHEKNRHQLRRS